MKAKFVSYFYFNRCTPIRNVLPAKAAMFNPVIVCRKSQKKAEFLAIAIKAGVQK